MTDDHAPDRIAFPRVQVHELRVATEAVARDFTALAETLTPAGELSVTGRRATELGTTLRTFGELYERYFTQDLRDR